MSLRRLGGFLVRVVLGSVLGLWWFLFRRLVVWSCLRAFSLRPFAFLSILWDLRAFVVVGARESQGRCFLGVFWV